MQPDGNARINKIVQFVEGNYQRKISLEDIGEEVGMSATSVCRFFKKYTHQNLWNYLNGFRIVRAAQMIVETDDPIAEIGMRCGFYNISNFNRAFRERIGSPPGDYRRKFGSTARLTCFWTHSPSRPANRKSDLRRGRFLSFRHPAGISAVRV